MVPLPSIRQIGLVSGIVLATISTPSAQVLPALSVSLNGTSFSQGQTIEIDAALTAGAGGRTVDAYVVMQTPSGEFRSLQLG